MTDHRNEKSNLAQGAVPAEERPADATKGDGKGVGATGGDKGSKNTNDYESSGRDRNADQGEHHPENSGREGADNEKVSRRPEEGPDADGAGESGDPDPAEKPDRERVTEKGVVPTNQTKNHSQVAAVPAPGADPGKKLRKTSKRNPGSRKPGTEQTKAERAAQVR